MEAGGRRLHGWKWSCRRHPSEVSIGCTHFYIMASSPNSAHELKREALTLFQAGRLAEARDVCLKASDLDSTDAVIWCLLGTLNGVLGDIEEAIKCLRTATGLQSDYAEAHANLGVALEKQGRLMEALASYQQAIRLRPGHADAYFNAGNASKAAGRLNEAVQYYRAALQIRPGDAETLTNMGAVLVTLNRHTDAVACYEQALRNNPSSAEAWNNLGASYEALGRIQDALEHYQHALSIRPAYAEAQNNLGNAFAGLNKPVEAMASYRCAIALKPDYVEAHYNLGLVCARLGLAQEAVAAYRCACTLKPGFAAPCENLLFMLNYDPTCGTTELFDQHIRWGKTRGIIRERGHANAPDPHRRLRIGYVSPDFRDHAVAYFLEPILMNQDRHDIETFCYAEITTPDTVTARLKELAQHWRSTTGRTDEEVARMIESDGIDILVDLSGHTAGNRLDVFARRPAPVQATYLGYPNTTGLTTIDYNITDEIVDPVGQSELLYTEALVRLPGAFYCYRPPDEAPAVGTAPVLDNGYITFGSLNTLLKINDQVMALWAKLLEAVPSTRLILQSSTFATLAGQELYRERFHSHGIAPERLVLLPATPLAKHLAVYQKIDIALDPFPWNGHTTSCHALWMGVPVITLKGPARAGRLTTSLLTCLGLTKFIAYSPNDYLRIAETWANDIQGLVELRAKLRASMADSPLCDSKGFTHTLEQAYREMWRKWCVSTATGNK